MGTTNSALNRADVVNKAVTEVIMRTIQDCSAYMNVDQTVNSSGVNLFGNTNASSTLSASCLSNIKMTADLSNAIAASIKQSADQNNVALSSGFNGSTSLSNISNLVQNTITNEVLQKCSASLTARQTINQSGIQIGSNITLSASLVSSCIMNQVSNTGLANKLIAETESKTTQVATGPFDSMVGSFYTYWYVVLGFIGLIIAGIFAYKMSK